MKNSADPSRVGNFLLGMRTRRPKMKLSELADTIPWETMSPYSPTESTVDVTIREYQQEKIQEARQGMASAIRYCVEHGIDWTPEIGNHEGAPPIVSYDLGKRLVGPSVLWDDDPGDCTGTTSGIDRNGDVTHPTE